MQEKDESESDSQRYIGITPHVPQRRRRRGDAEKKRRKRINKCLDDLEKIVPEVRRRRLVAKVDKAEILEMTVEFVRQATSRDLFSRTRSPSTILPSQMEISHKGLMPSRNTRHDHLIPNIIGHTTVNNNPCTSTSCTTCDSHNMTSYSSMNGRHNMIIPPSRAANIPNCMRCHFPEYPSIRSIPGSIPRRRTFEEFSKIQ